MKPAEIEYNGVTYTLHPAVVKKAQIGYEDHGIFAINLDLDYGGSGQGTGWLALDEPDPTVDRYTSAPRWGSEYGMNLIISVTKLIAGEYSRWGSIPDKPIFAVKESPDKWGNFVLGLASWPNPSEVLIFKEHYEYVKNRRKVLETCDKE